MTLLPNGPADRASPSQPGLASRGTRGSASKGWQSPSEHIRACGTHPRDPPTRLLVIHGDRHTIHFIECLATPDRSNRVSRAAGVRRSSKLHKGPQDCRRDSSRHWLTDFPISPGGGSPPPPRYRRFCDPLHPPTRLLVRRPEIPPELLKVNTDLKSYPARCTQKMNPNQGDGSHAKIESARASALSVSSRTWPIRARRRNDDPPR